jgi:hypothetical protein
MSKGLCWRQKTQDSTELAPMERERKDGDISEMAFLYEHISYFHRRALPGREAALLELCDSAGRARVLVLVMVL